MSILKHLCDVFCIVFHIRGYIPYTRPCLAEYLSRIFGSDNHQCKATFDALKEGLLTREIRESEVSVVNLT